MSTTNSITVFGSATAGAVPDTMAVTLGVEARHDRAEGAYSLAASRAGDLVATLQDAAPGARLSTTGIGLRARTVWRNDENVLAGYEADTTLRLAQVDIARVSGVLGAAVAAGGDALRIHSVQAEVSDPSLAWSAARDSAFAEARAKAEQLAALAGCTLGKALRVKEVTQDGALPVLRVKAADMAAASMPVAAGEQELTATLEVRWELLERG
ncbi:SIMPL domain-containing protein [Paeniglutamicibacter sp. R2-26]|uniref:SIMPL domain-containing protein n=1 Tax=Paeniglutamicibacter sp. R2-26 TaxID=3144417 RepID=UPI003EE778DE